MARNVDGFGIEGEFFVDGTGSFGQGDDKNIINYNKPPVTQPSLWCQWVPNKDGTEIKWDGSEKFYEYVPWIQYLITKILAPRGYALNGEVKWQGEDPEDMGIIEIVNNEVKVKHAIITFE